MRTATHLNIVPTVSSVFPLIISRTFRFLTSLGIVAVGVACHSLCASAGPTLAQMYHMSWTVRDGAPRNIISIAQTRDGFLWLATANGLVQFDGHSFEAYQPLSGDQFPVDEVSALKATPDGGMWIGYGRSGVSFLKNGHNTSYGESAGLSRNTVAAFAVDHANTVWLATADGVERLVGSTWKPIDQEWSYPAKTPTYALLVDRSGTLWAGTKSGLLYLRKGEHAFRAAPEVRWEINSIAEGSDGTLWLSSLDRPGRALDADSVTLRRDIPPIDSRSLSATVGKDGSLWIPSIHGIVRLLSPAMPMRGGGREGNSVERFGKSDGLSGNVAYQVLEDSEGSTWIATNAGLDQFRPAAFTVVPLPEGARYASVAVADSGRLWLGGALVDARTGRVLASAPASLRSIQTSYRDADGSVWLGGSDSLWKAFGGTLAEYPLPAVGGSDHSVQAIAKDRSGALWVSIVRNGVYRLSNDQWSKVTTLEAAPNNLCLSMKLDSQGRIWFTYAKPNQVQVLVADTLITYGANEGMDIGFTTTIDEIDSHILIGGEKGIAVLEGTKFRRLVLDGNASMSSVSGVLRQENGDLWINQASGIVRIDAADFRRALSNPEVPMQYRLFDYLDGLDEQAWLPRPLPTIHDGGGGLLYFTGRTHLLVMDTSRLKRNLIRPAVAVRSLLADAKEYPNPSDAVLLPNIERVTFNYSASSLLIPKRVQFRYRLEGFDEKWQTGNDQRLAVYSRLPPGHYLFHVVASNNDGVWNEQGASVAFTIPPSFVQSLPFKVLCTALVLALLWFIYQMRLQQIKMQIRRRLYERLDERTRIARDLHDTFFQGIQGLLLRFNTAVSLLDRDGAAALEIFRETLEQSDRVMLEGRALMLDLREGEGKTTELADALSVVGDDLRKCNPAEFRVTVIGNPRPLHPIVLEELHRFGREALANAFRHAHAETIEAELHYERNQLRLRVRDDGVGIDSQVLSRGSRAGHWGLPGMRERAKKLGGQLDIWSRTNAGTEIELSVPAAAAYRSRPMRSWLARLIRSTELH